MAPSSDDIARLRRMVNEPNTDTYDDTDMSAVIARYAVVDTFGQPPQIRSATYPPTLIANPQWIESYDLHSAAAEVWEEKAAVAAQDYDFDSPLDDGTYQRSQVYEQYMAQARYHMSRRAPSTIRVLSPHVPPLSFVGNVWNDIDQPPEWG